jgi:NAD(P)-dependent dehydrogenase (short-subunit alcohol dehydrogenase family)
MAPAFTPERIPRQEGKTIVVTGANSGIGFEAARMLAGAGAHVVLACRNETAAAAAADQIRARHAGASVEHAALDLASLASVRAFAARFLEAHPRLDVLVNNAGVMALPRCTTADGFEMQIGTNHLGHFALTGLLIDRICASTPARVVTVSSGMHHLGWIRFDDLQGEKRYRRWLAYGQSKLANLLFAYELDRRLAAKGRQVRSLACHPGYAATNLQGGAARMAGSSLGQRVWRWLNRAFAQSAEMGALPTVFAAAAEEARGRDYVGPRFLELYGYPSRGRSNARSRDEGTARRLWEVSEELTGVRFGA